MKYLILGILLTLQVVLLFSGQIPESNPLVGIPLLSTIGIIALIIINSISED